MLQPIICVAIYIYTNDSSDVIGLSSMIDIFCCVAINDRDAFDHIFSPTCWSMTGNATRQILPSQIPEGRSKPVLF